MNDDNKSLAKVEQSNLTTSQNSLLNLRLDQVQSLAKVFAASGMFQDVGKDAAKAFVKILAGQEMGIPPFQALSDIHLFQGKATAGANIHASKVKQHPRYDYEVKNWTNKGCSIEFYEYYEGTKFTGGKRKLKGIVQYDENNARQAGLLSKDNWQKYPRNMYFARAMTDGVRLHCPDVLGGVTAYTPDELAGGRDYIEVEETSMVDERKVPDNVDPKTGEILDEPVDKNLLEEDQDPDMPPDFLKQDDVADPTDEELANPTLPDMPETKHTRAK